MHFDKLPISGLFLQDFLIKDICIADFEKSQFFIKGNKTGEMQNLFSCDRFIDIGKIIEMFKKQFYSSEHILICFSWIGKSRLRYGLKIFSIFSLLITNL